LARRQLLSLPLGDLLFHYIFKLFRGYILSRTKIFYSNKLGFSIPYPVLISIDDCGCNLIYDRYGLQYGVDIGVYERLSRLAYKFKTIFPCAFIIKFLDESSPLDSNYKDKLISFIRREHGKSIEFSFHGYHHELTSNAIGEFALIEDGELRSVPEEIQFESFNKSWILMDKLDLPKPKLFIPPYNLWTPKVTDHIASKFNVKWLSSPPIFSYGSLLINYGETGKLNSNLYFTPRVIIPIQHDDVTVNWRRRKTIPSISIHDVLRCSEPPHNIMTHIGNYLRNSVFNLIKDILEGGINELFLYIPRDSSDAFNQWLFYKYMYNGKVQLRSNDRLVKIRGEFKEQKSIKFTLKSINDLEFHGDGILGVEESVEGVFKKYSIETLNIFNLTVKSS